MSLEAQGNILGKLPTFSRSLELGKVILQRDSSVQTALIGRFQGKTRPNRYCVKASHKPVIITMKGTMEAQHNPNEPGKPSGPGQQGGQEGDRERQERERQQREREKQGGGGGKQGGGGGQERGGGQQGGGQQGGR
jgi:hypothetical protein